MGCKGSKAASQPQPARATLLNEPEIKVQPAAATETSQTATPAAAGAIPQNQTESKAQPDAATENSQSAAPTAAAAAASPKVDDEDVRGKIGTVLDKALNSGELAQAIVTVAATNASQVVLKDATPANGSDTKVVKDTTEKAPVNAALSEEPALSKAVPEELIETKVMGKQSGWGLFCCGGHNDHDIVVEAQPKSA